MEKSNWSYKSHKMIIILLFIFNIICGCRSNRNHNKINYKYPNLYNVNVDSLIKEAISLDDINGVVYITNVNCSNCIGELIEYVRDVSEIKIDDTLYLAAYDTLMLKFILQKEFGVSSPIVNMFSVKCLKDNRTGVLCDGFIVKHSRQAPFSCEKYQPGFLDKMFNL